MEYTENDFNTIVEGYNEIETLEKVLILKVQYYYYSDIEPPKLESIWKGFKNELHTLFKPFLEMPIYQKYERKIYQVVKNIYDNEVNINHTDDIREIQKKWREWVTADE